MRLFALSLLAVVGTCNAYPKVVVSGSAPAVEQHAAQELTRYLGNMSLRLLETHSAHAHTGARADDGVIAVGYDASVKLGAWNL